MKPVETDPLHLYDPDADLEAVREKYRQERDKRLREDGSEQFLDLAGEVTHNDVDPYVEPGFTRAPIEEETEVAIIGGGFGGMLMAVRLLDAGIGDFRIIEAAGDFGGTWYWNRYPGVQCDVESYVYMPLLEELGTIPTEKYAHGPEIFAHAQAIGRHYSLYERASFQTQVSALEWDEGAQRWLVGTDRGDRIRARFVCMANGPYSKPKLPRIPGVHEFAGHTFHTSRWDYDYTGGDTTGGLSKLADKRVGVLGTGATAIQCVPHLGRDAGEVYVFQRTPSTVDVRDNYPTDPKFAEGLEPGWQQKRMTNFNVLMDGGAQSEDLVGDRWTELTRGLYKVIEAHPNAAELSEEEIGLIAERVDLAKMERVRARVDQVVEDSATAEALKPWYRYLCKRPCFHDEYLQAFNRPNVTLVDTDGKGVDKFTPRGVVANGREYELDCLIFATGFDVSNNYTRRVGYEIAGRGGSEAGRQVARPNHDVPELLHPRLSQLLLHDGVPGGAHPQHPPLHQRASPAPGLRHPRGARSRRHDGGADPASRGRLGRRNRQGQRLHRDPALLHPRLLQRRRQARRKPRLVGRLLPRGLGGVFCAVEGMASERRTGGARGFLSARMEVSDAGRG